MTTWKFQLHNESSTKSCWALLEKYFSFLEIAGFISSTLKEESARNITSYWTVFLFNNVPAKVQREGQIRRNYRSLQFLWDQCTKGTTIKKRKDKEGNLELRGEISIIHAFLKFQMLLPVMDWSRRSVAHFSFVFYNQINGWGSNTMHIAYLCMSVHIHICTAFFSTDFSKTMWPLQHRAMQPTQGRIGQHSRIGQSYWQTKEDTLGPEGWSQMPSVASGDIVGAAWCRNLTRFWIHDPKKHSFWSSLLFQRDGFLSILC